MVRTALRAAQLVQPAQHRNACIVIVRAWHPIGSRRRCLFPVRWWQRVSCEAPLAAGAKPAFFLAKPKKAGLAAEQSRD